MMRFLFIRHGKKGGHGDPLLTLRGREEVKLLANDLSRMEVGAIFTSPLRRAMETAEILAKVFGVPTIQDRRLRERTNWGDIEGQSHAEFVEIWNRCSRDRHFKPSGSDSSFEAGRRIESFISDRFNEGHSGDILAVSHGGVIADFLRNVFADETLERIRPGFTDDPYSSKIMRECSITTVSFSEKGYGLEDIGAVPAVLAGYTPAHGTDAGRFAGRRR